MEKIFFSPPDGPSGKDLNRRATEEECWRAELYLDHFGVYVSRYHCEDRWYVMIIYEHAKGAKPTSPDEEDMDPSLQAKIDALDPLPKRFEPNEFVQCCFRLHDADVIFYANLPLAKHLAENQVD